MKKETPLQVLQTLEPFLKGKSILYETLPPNGFLLRFKDRDGNSDFYFNIEAYKLEKQFELLIDRKPHSIQSVENDRTWINAAHLEVFFQKWIDLLKGYENVTVFNDPIIEAFANEYYSEFEIVDEDAETHPFTTKQILLLDEHLEYIENEIEKFQTEENKNEIQEIKNEVVILRDNLTKKPKKWVIEKLSKTWAKITKQGPKFIKEFLSEVKKETIKEGVKILIEGAIDHLK
jgi:hypothetical protein